MDGVIVVDKARGMTSHDVVVHVRKMVGQSRVGHFGTLDPMATGVLPTAIGRATRLQRFYLTSKKTYSGSIRFGYSTTTYDSEGSPSSQIMKVSIDPKDLESARLNFLGEIEQTPPSFSAKKISGVSAHRLARKSRPVHLHPVKVHIFRIDLCLTSADEATFEVECSGGTYLRSIAHDLGRMLGCGAHLISLRRIASGDFGLEQAVEIRPNAEREGKDIPVAWKEHFISMDELVTWLPSVSIPDEELKRVKNGLGVLLKPEQIPEGKTYRDSNLEFEWIRLFNSNRKLIGLGLIRPLASGQGPIEIKPKIILVAN